MIESRGCPGWLQGQVDCPQLKHWLPLLSPQDPLGFPDPCLGTRSACTHLILEAHVRDVTPDCSVILVLTAILGPFQGKAVTEGLLISPAAHLTKVDGPQSWVGGEMLCEAPSP